ncbi:hypothetical protein Syun_009266 [Stephania yunnanensis]|uniref:Uncharacterized protein n=1 Tax=Stephania yunnanensis TaxID=152371 RepID=A0AAP0KEB9_9MAGN
MVDLSHIDLREDITYEEPPIQILDLKVKRLSKNDISLVLVKCQHHGDEELT